MIRLDEHETRRFCRFVFFNLVICIIAYLLLISNELTNNLDGMWSGAEYRNYSWVVGIGRWFWPVVGKLQMNVCPEPFTSVFALTMYVLGSCVVAWWFGLKDSLKGYLLVTGASVNTAVCATLTFRYTSPTFAMAYMLSVLAAWALSKEKVTDWLASVICLMLALALYQSNIGCACVLALLYIIWLFQNENGYRKVIRFFFRFAVSLLASCAVYKIVWDLSMKIFQIAPNEYKGASDASVMKILTGLPRSLACTYREFLRYFFQNDLRYSIYQRLTAFSALLLLLTLVSLILSGRKLAGKSALKWLLAAACLLLIPPASNIAMILAADTEGASIQMTMPMATVLPFLLCITDLGECNSRLMKNVDRLRTAIVLFLLFGSFLMVSVDQHVMLKSRENATAMMNRVAVDLGEDTDPEGGFVFVGSVADNPNFLRDQLWERSNDYARYGEVITPGNHAVYTYAGLLRDSGLNLTYNWNYRNWDEMIARKEVREMPIYPDDGYIEQFGRTIVIKFSNTNYE